jgi:hypothetical protein
VGAAWRLAPLSEAAFESRDLTIILKEAYKVAKAAEQTGGVVFVGMDCPFLTREMVAGAAQHTDAGKAFICPADDGGYTLLALPRGAPEGEPGWKLRWDHLKVLGPMRKSQSRFCLPRPPRPACPRCIRRRRVVLWQDV